ncbi:methyltransferase, FkbM family [Hyunsoonleella jejuensis]|uniref:Methyltransferase, FkbM family n=1 Tax=Hyunsoonleella jejuensis TaxID=419940 RepID=A0A1H9DFP2_9FLAO|nr:FkbM family methyltransferase [Hyunsoonleella jejuensis]SEQ11613.1 methyltransferase, FkbM family [Hyunsoonleella jejuensis]
MKKLLKKLFKSFNYDLIKTSTLNRLIRDEKIANEYKLILQYSSDVAANYLKFRQKSKAQIKQDLFVLMELNFKTDGFFVEFGSTDGVSMSNTFLLEKEFNWRGILAEPGKYWHNALEKNRTAFIEKNCVWHKTGEILQFQEADSHTLSTIVGYGDTDSHSKTRNAGNSYTVTTISLNDLLLKYNAPKIIDYLSIDTEGSEYIILNSFDFDQYKFRVITVEHNYTDLRDKIFNLLTSKGYYRIHTEHSLFDDWYILEKPNNYMR